MSADVDVRYGDIKGDVYKGWTEGFVFIETIRGRGRDMEDNCHSQVQRLSGSLPHGNHQEAKLKNKDALKR